MLKEMLKIANVPNEKALLKKYPREADFLREHGAQMLYMYGGGYAEGGMIPQDASMQQAGGGQDPQAQQEQIVQMIAQALQQGVPDDQIIAKLVEMGLPQDQAAEMVQMVKQKLQEQMAGQQGGGQQMSPEGAPMSKLGGNTPCYNCGGMYQDGGSTLYSTQGQTLRNFTNTLANSSGWHPYHTMLPVVGPNNSGNTSRTPAGLPSLGHGLVIPMNFANGGAYSNVPQHGQPQGPNDGTYYQSGYFAIGGEPCVGAHMIRNEEGRCVCEKGFEADQMTGECYPIGEESPDDEGAEYAPNQTVAPRPGGVPIPGGGFNAGFGLEGKNYNLNYGFGVGADMKSNVTHNLDFKIPKAFRVGVNSGELAIKGNYVPGKSWMGDLSAGIPLSGVKGRGDLLKFTGGMGQQFRDPELNAAMAPGANDFMKVNSGKTPLDYNAGVEYLGKMFGAKGPNVKIKASYTKKNKFGGLTKFVGGGMPEEQVAGQEQQQQLMQQVAQMLQQGTPEQVLQQLVQMGIPQDQAQQLMQMVMEQMQGGGVQKPVMRIGGMTNQKYKKGGEYEMSQSEIQDLIKKGYKIQYL